MIDFDELKFLLANALEERSYKEEVNITIPNIKYISYSQSPNFIKAKHLFAIVYLPDNIVELKIAKNFFAFIRKSLLDNYGDAILWKELEMSFIVLCGDVLFGNLKKDEGAAIDVASFSMSSMLGACVINRTNLEYFLHSTWGLHFSGKDFKMMAELAEKWIVDKKASFSGEKT